MKNLWVESKLENFSIYQSFQVLSVGKEGYKNLIYKDFVRELIIFKLQWLLKEKKFIF